MIAISIELFIRIAARAGGSHKPESLFAIPAAAREYCENVISLSSQMNAFLFGKSSAAAIRACTMVGKFGVISDIAKLDRPTGDISLCVAMQFRSRF